MLYSTLVYATDISQTQHSDRPPNLRILEQDFIESKWLFADNWFDIVHMQCLKESIPNWVTVFKQAERVLKPGGFLEVIEHTSQIYPKGGTVENLYPELYDLGGMLRNVGIRIGRSMSVVEEERLIPALQEAGFQIMRNAIIPCSLTPPAQQGRAYDAAVFAQAAFLIDLKGKLIFSLSRHWPDHMCQPSYLLRLFVEALAWRPEWVVHYAQEIIKELRVVGQGDVTDLHIFVQHIISQKVYTQNKSRSIRSPKAMACELKA
ncbi:hypothetical protein NUW58_g5533 [Xylaria curta]|uniref:Uncharacterized protein n=1 Tax=Xylaria curta TaxID=42375 RepID=A0ACC1P2A6_9PEZI|nr:hypothetical protein NUW58_g5533 [Xylaria curta]